MTGDIEVNFLVELQNPLNESDILQKLKINGRYGFFDDYEITNATGTCYEITAYIDEFDVCSHKFANNFNDYKAYIKSISNEFVRCDISYYTYIDDAMDYDIDCGNHDYSVDVTFKLGFNFNLAEVENFDSIEFIIDDIACNSKDVNPPGGSIRNTFDKIYKDLEKLLDSNSSIYTGWWCYEADGTIILTDYVKDLDRGIWVGDGIDLLIQLRDELNEIINQVN